jgi:hypothetical protein
VIVEEHDIFGDGVNIAARLEALAERGGICISRTVRDQIRDKLPYVFEDKGELSVKNIARPVRVYTLRPETVADLPAPSLLPSASIFELRRTTPVDNRAAVRQSQRRPGAAIFRGRDHRGPTKFELVVNLKTAQALGLTARLQFWPSPTRSLNETSRRHHRRAYRAAHCARPVGRSANPS